MDPITTAIVAALAKVGESAIGDAYRALKGVIKKKFGDQSDVAEAVEGLEKRPDSAGRKATLQEELEAAGALQDPEVLRAADALLAKIQEYAEKMGATGINLKELEAGRATIKNVTATGTGVKGEKWKIAGDLEISDVHAGQTDSKNA